MSPRLKALQEVEGLRLQMEYILSEMNDVEEQERAYAIEVVQAKIQRHRELEQTIAKAKEKCATEDQADVDRFQNHKDQMQGRRDQLRWLVNKSRADATRLHIARYAEAIMKQPEKTSGPWQKPGLPAGSPPAAKTATAKPATAREGSPHSHVKN
ncbi:hypothetical protein GGF46_003167 [Coemansia sp. RSA 552]|nr:hypothetical protein GGF46_003167 [Coemansia sp. RSA 552]